ncbi:hypothetical protein EXIGLDRAFT_584680, partial [Exidia glandulosa HHB12029]
DAGGKALFDVKARNDAAYIVWLSRYLAPDKERPIWAFLADALFSMHARVADDKRISIEMRVNPFCQDWKPNPHKLPFILQQILRVARAYDLVLDRPYIPYRVRVMMPAWAHLGRFARAWENNPTSKCLKTRHEASMVEHLEELAEQDELDHSDYSDCECENCETDRGIGCPAPYKCSNAAGDLLAILAPKWNLNTIQDDLESPNPVDRTLDQRALDNGEPVVFRKFEAIPKEVAHLYRIFSRHLTINRETTVDEIWTRDAATTDSQPNNRPVAVAYACGAVLHGGLDGKKSGYAVHFPEHEASDEHGSCQSQHHTQERSAVIAIIKAAEKVDPDRRLFIVTNSKSAVKKLTVLAAKNEQRGWLDHPNNADVFRHAMAILRSRAAETTLACVTRKHARPETVLMERTSRRALNAARGTVQARVVPPGIEKYDAPGAQLHGITQRAAHTVVRQIRALETPARRRTRANVRAVKAAVERQNGLAPTEEQIWISIKSRDLARNVRNFLWKGLHGGHKIGDYFNGMPAPWRDYALCPLCDTSETLQHILFECKSRERETVWDLASNLMSTRLQLWPTLNLGSVLGCMLLVFNDEPNGGLTRAMRIIISESAFLIWKIRCERRIEHEDDTDLSPSTDEITGRWRAVINARISHDRHLTNRRRYRGKALDEDLVLETW